MNGEKNKKKKLKSGNDLKIGKIIVQNLKNIIQ